MNNKDNLDEAKSVLTLIPKLQQEVRRAIKLIVRNDRKLDLVVKYGKYCFYMLLFVLLIFGVNLYEVFAPKSEYNYFQEEIVKYGYQPNQTDAEEVLKAGNEELMRIFLAAGIFPRAEKVDEIIENGAKSGLFNPAVGTYLQEARKLKEVPPNSWPMIFNYVNYVIDGSFELSNGRMKIENFCSGVGRFKVVGSKFVDARWIVTKENCKSAFKDGSITAMLGEALRMQKLYYELDQTTSLQSIPRTIVDYSNEQRIEMLRKFALGQVNLAPQELN